MREYLLFCASITVLLARKFKQMHLYVYIMSYSKVYASACMRAIVFNVQYLSHFIYFCPRNFVYFSHQHIEADIALSTYLLRPEYHCYSNTKLYKWAFLYAQAHQLCRNAKKYATKCNSTYRFCVIAKFNGNIIDTILAANATTTPQAPTTRTSAGKSNATNRNLGCGLLIWLTRLAHAHWYRHMYACVNTYFISIV